jgi:glycosyltransferase involved in cell wall biosynthesis
MLPVLFINSSPERGGLEVVLLNALRHLDRRRYVPHVFSTVEGPFVEEVREADVPVRVRPSGRTRQLGRLRRTGLEIAAYAEEIGAALCHIDQDKSHVFAWAAQRRRRMPIVKWYHGFAPRGLHRGNLLAWASLIAPAAARLANSRCTAEAYRRTRPFGRELQVLYYGIDLEALASGRSSAEVREQWGVAPDQPLAILPGRLEGWKGQRTFIEAAATVHQQLPAARFWIVGGAVAIGTPDKGYPAELEARVAELGLSDVVTFTGHQSAPYDYMVAADVVVHASTSPEPFGLVPVEAMGLGRTVIAANAGGPAESVIDGQTGILIPPGKPDLLAEALLELCRDPERRERLGQAAARHVAENFSADRMAADLMRVYDEVRGRVTPDGK